MSRLDSPARLDDPSIAIAEYVCGLLKPEERAQIHILLSRDDEALALALAWEAWLLSLVDAIPRMQPAPALRERLQRTLGIDPPAALQPPPQPQLLRQRSAPPISMPPADSPFASEPKQPSKPTSAAKPTPVAGHIPAPTQKPIATSRSTPAQDPVSTPASPPTSAKTPPANVTRGITPHIDPVPNPQSQSDHVATSPSVNPSPDAEKARRRLVRKLWFWRLIGLCATTAAIVGFMLPGEPPPPPVQVVKVAPTRAAILQPPGSSSTPGWTATLDPQGNLMMRPLVHTEVPVGGQTLLWTRSETIPEPRLLGRIDPNRPVQVPAAQLGAIAEDQLLEITLEKDADAAAGVPNGPILFIGRMAVFGAEAASAATGAPGAATGGAITRDSRP